MKKLNTLLILLYFLTSAFLYVKGQNIVVSHATATAGIPLNERAQFAVSDSRTETPRKFVSYEEFKKTEVKRKKAVWMRFSLQNTDEDTLYIYTRHPIAKMKIYSLENNELKQIGVTGFASKISDHSLQKNYSAIAVQPFKEKTFLLKISSERYLLNVPTIFVSPFEYNDPESKSFDTISLITAGFEFCLFLTAVLFLLFHRGRKFPDYLIPFLLINFTDAIYFLSRSNILIFESGLIPAMTNSNFWNALGDVNILLYYLFYRSFFDIPKKSATYMITTIGILFWIFQIIIELTDFTNPALINLASGYLNFAAILDSIVLLTILIFVYTNRLNSIFYKLGAIGLTLIVLSSLEISWSRIFDDNYGWLTLSLDSFKLLQFAMLVNLTSFITAMLYSYITSEREKNEMKLQLVTSELQHQKDMQRERERISDDMHDDLGAGISAMKLQAEFIRQKVRDENIVADIDDLLKTSEDMNLSMREMVWSLNSQNDNLLHFTDYVTRYTQNFFKKTVIKVQISSSEISNKTISAECRRNLFLCIKEGLNNIYKHSGAKRVHLHFEQAENEFRVSLQDDGIGFGENTNDGNGFHSMNRRMSLLKGECTINSSENGTHLLFIIRF